MKILITGAAGFLGQHLAKELLKDASHTVILTDLIEPPIPKNSLNPQNAQTIQADLLEEGALSKIVPSDLSAIYIFHGTMSVGSELNFPLGLRVNIDATRLLLEHLRTHNPGIRVIYASSAAVYGRPFPEQITEKDMPTPESSYGAEKMVGEYLVNEYTRRGFITGFSLRFPTIVIRPGKPSAAASSFLSGLAREPLAGKECVIPIKDRGWKHWVSSTRTLIYNLIVVLNLPADSLPPHIRQINPPGFQVTVQGMLDALENVGGKEALALVREEEEPEAKRILYSWADSYDNSLGLRLGMRQDSSFEKAIREYVEDMKEIGEL